jgi:restriction system protein
VSDDNKTPEPLPPFVEDGSQDAAAIIARNEDQRRRQQQLRAAIQSSAVEPEWVPQPPPVLVEDGWQDSTAAIIAMNERLRRQNFAAVLASMQGGDEVFVPPDNFPVLVSQAVIIPYEKTFEGELIRAVTLPLLDIIQKIMEDPSRMYQIDPRKLEEIIAATYEQSGLFDEVTLTPRSGDRGKDLIVVKRGFGSVRFVESVKRYRPGHVVTAEEVDALIGVMNKQPQTSKGIISTTWEFAPKIMDDPDIARLVPTRLELVNGKALVERFKEYTTPKCK